MEKKNPILFSIIRKKGPKSNQKCLPLQESTADRGRDGPLKLRKYEKVWLMIALLCALAAALVTAACRTPASAATLVLLPLTQSEAPAAQSAEETLVDINTASVDELDALPDIGPALAQRIVDYRAVNGPFRKIEEIMQVPGIGAGKFEKLQDRITAVQEDGT